MTPVIDPDDIQQALMNDISERAIHYIGGIYQSTDRDPLHDPKDLMALQLLGLIFGKMNGADMAVVNELFRDILETLDFESLTPIVQELIANARLLKETEPDGH